MLTALFHPLVARWFTERFGEPTPPQALGWQHIASGADTLIAAPTGSGKTLAAFLWSIHHLVTQGAAGALGDRMHVVYVSPLKALGNDIQKNLQQPLSEILQLASASGLSLPEIRVAVRSGDTPARERQSMVRRPPHILITTPESLYILLTAERSRRALASAATVIVDEIHAVAGDKRGVHLALSLERLDALAGRRLQRIGLSATQKPIEEIGRLLVGMERIAPDGRPQCAIVDVGHRRAMELHIELPDQELGPIATHELWDEIYDRIVAQVQRHRTTLVFVNTRRLVERVAHQLTARLGEGRVAAHHGSLSRPTRLAAEEGLKAGTLPVVVATASLELGIDIGHVELVCHLGAPRALATLLQRVGRSGHGVGSTPKGILFPLTRDELVQCAAAVRAVRAGELDRVLIPEASLDILAQQIVATAASGDLAEEALWTLVQRAYPFRHLRRDDFEAVLEMLAEGVATRRGRSSAHLHWDRVQGRLRGRRGARLAAITSGGAIPDTADYDVLEEPAETFVGKVNEDFAVESLAGDIFLLGNRSWRIRRVESGRVRVEDAQGAPPTIPFWLGEAPARTAELSQAVADLRAEVAMRLADRDAAIQWLQAETGVDSAGAEQVVAYIAETVSALGVVPTQHLIVAERFFDEAGGMQVVLHAPFGGRVNRAWGMALRKRFCLTFDFELQAAATDDGIVLSLGAQHSFPLESVFAMLRPAALERDLVQAALAAPMFGNRWRWNSTRALALLRYQGGKKVPIAIQRMRAEDLLAAVFPAQLACGDNHPGPIEPPDHPLVKETIANCLQEAMDLEGLRALLVALERGEVRTVAVDTPAPSPMSHEILNANPYAFLDDAPLEERRARAVSLRRTDPNLAAGVGALDQSAIDEVRAQAWPDVRDAEELHDVLLSLGLLPVREAAAWAPLAAELLQRGRVTQAQWSRDGSSDVGNGYIAAERMQLVQLALPEVRFEPPIDAPPLRRGLLEELTREDALRVIVQGWMECVGPTTASTLAARLGLGERQVQAALLALEASGTVLRGRFTPGALSETLEWCERRLLARIHRLTLGRLRREIAPVSVADFIRFLLRWQHVQPGTQQHGRGGLLEVIGQLQGLELPAPAWERDILPARISRYDPSTLESLCLAGMVTWGRLAVRMPTPEIEDPLPSPARGAWHTRRTGPTRAAPLAFMQRDDLPWLLNSLPAFTDGRDGLSAIARDVADVLGKHGASFLNDLVRQTGYLPMQVEEALWELVACGLVTGDGSAGLRTLLTPDVKRRPSRHGMGGRRNGGAPARLLPVGRWSLLRTGWTLSPSPSPLLGGGYLPIPVSPPGGRKDVAQGEGDGRDEAMARQLLRRYGVMLRDLLAREHHAPSWRTLLGIYRRMEARGEVRGGRFVAGLVGEQFALPEAVEALRAVRRQRHGPETAVVAAADPLNVVGILTPGPRISPFAQQVIVYQDGVPVDIGTLGAVRSRLQGFEVPSP
ncbi:MAG: DEAD/DEAH box helicase [Nitrospinae bacterium]|nr:DEAD/DEAH box helicase [Nitrospinota bacterium]